MTPSFLAHTSFPRAAPGVFAGAARPGANFGWGRPAGSPPGVASARLVGGLARGEPLRDNGVAGCGAASRVVGGRDGGEPFYLEGCGCGGRCGEGTSAIRGDLAELPDDVEPPPPWNSARYVQWAVAHRVGGPVTLPEPGDDDGAERHTDSGDSGLTVRYDLPDRGDRYEIPSGTCLPAACSGYDECDGNEPPLVKPGTGQATCKDASHRFPGTVHPCDSEAEELLREAWCMLRENLDLVKWVSCMGFCERDVLVALLRRPQDHLFWMECRADVVDASARAYSLAVPGWGWIEFQLTSATPSVRAFEAGSSADRTCAVIAVAAWLFHELTHVAQYGGNDVAHLPYCEPSYVSENALLWALLQRYQGAAASDCCDDWYADLDDVFAASINLTLSRNCNP